MATTPLTWKVGMGMINRRQVLRTGAAGAAGAITSTMLLSTPAGAASRVSTAPMGRTARPLLSRSRFTAQLGATFSMKSPVATWQVRLERVGDLAPVLEPADEERFSLLFSAASPGPPQGTFVFTRPGFDATSIFVIPDGDRTRFVAIVNRL